MAKSIDDRGRGAPLARRDEGAYCWYVTEEQRSQSGCVGREGDRLSHLRASVHAAPIGTVEPELTGRLVHVVEHALVVRDTQHEGGVELDWLSRAIADPRRAVVVVGVAIDRLLTGGLRERRIDLVGLRGQ